MLNKKETIMEITVDLAVEHMCAWAKLANRIGDPWDDELYQLWKGSTIKEVLIKEIKDILSFDIKEILSCKTFKEKGKEIYDNIQVLLELNNFENPEWTEKDARLVDELETLIYQRWESPPTKKGPFDGTPSEVLYPIFPFS